MLVQLHIYNTTNLNTFIITKEFSNHKPTYGSITAAIINLKLFTIHKIKKLAIPRIGCDLDNLDWPTIKGIILKHF